MTEIRKGYNADGTQMTDEQERALLKGSSKSVSFDDGSKKTRKPRSKKGE